MIKSTFAALAATPLFSGAAFVGPMLILKHQNGAYTSGSIETVVGYEGETPSGIGWYVSGGPTVTHTESTDDFGDVELVGYLGGSTISSTEISGTTNEDDIDWGARQGKFTF